MRNLPPFPLIMAAVLAVSGCASSGDGHYSGDYIGPVYPASGMYYGSRDYYYHDDYPDYIVAPRPPLHVPDRPDYRPGLHPEHPIANPPGTRPNRPSTLPADRPEYRARTPPCRISGLTHRPFLRAHAPWVVVAGAVVDVGVSDLPLSRVDFFFRLARATGDQAVPKTR